MKARFASGIVAAFLLCTPVFAQTAPPPDEVRLALARDIYDLTQSRTGVAQRLQTVADSMKQSLKETDKDRAERSMKALGEAIEDMRPRIRESWATAAAESFTVEELQAIKNFFASPVGAKLVIEQAAISQKMLPTILPEMMARVKAAMPPPPDSAAPSKDKP